ERLKKKWTSPIYAFFKATPTIEYSGKSRIHVFECIASHCKSNGKNQRFVRRNLTKGDATSTSNLCKHAIRCWGEEVVKAASQAKSVKDARAVLKEKTGNLQDGSLIFEFQRIGKGKETYSIRPPTKLESHAGHVRWMAESKQVFNMVGDPGYQRLMKNGRPEHYVPSGWTLSHNVRTVFTQCQQMIADLLQNLEGDLSYAIDTWTSPNSCALVAVTVHYETHGRSSSWLLDIVEVPESHTGAALASAFEKIMDGFGISKKV
ncbi:hypothetical protein M378DRAFT_82091, partial [Amanita muscaria Koide BX008]